MKKPIMLFLLLGLTGFINAQSALMNPLAIQSQGEMPPAMQKALQDEKESGLKYLLYHGKIVYGSTVNQYLDKILDNLLINEPQLRKEITLLVVKSPVVNAYANAQGILLINIGLIAQTSNEAELAFVLAHEIIHYALKHHYIERASDDNMNNFLQRHFASRDQESEADTKGIARFYSLSNYSYAAIDGAFDVLQYGHLPFDNIRFDRSFVENSYYQFPDKYFLQNVKPISNRDDYVDTLCTHPNIAKRRMAVAAIIAGKENEGRLDFVQPETLFNEIRDMARLECINQWIVKHQFAHAFYNAYALLKITPEPNLYADFLYNAMATSMYGMSKHKTNGSLRNVLGKVSDIEGEQQGAYYFWDVLNRQEFNVLALRMLWIAKSRQPDNPFLTKMANNLITDMVKTFKLKLDNFCDYPMGTNVDSIFDDPQTETQEATNKYDRIKQQKTTAKIKPSEKFKPVNYMLGDLKQDNDFVAFVQQRQNELEDAEILDAVKQPVTPHVQNDKLLFMKPRYLFVTKDRYSETKSKQGEKHLKTAIEKSVERLKIDNEFLDDVQIGQYSAAQYNSYGMLYDWIEYIYSIEGHIEPYYAVDVEGIAQDCQYLVMTSVVVQPRSMFTYTKIQDIMLSAICFYVSPAHIAGLFVARRNANSYFSVVNLKDGQVFYFANDYRERTHCTEGLIHAFMYDCLYALKKESKK